MYMYPIIFKLDLVGPKIDSEILRGYRAKKKEMKMKKEMLKVMMKIRDKIE